MCRKFLALVTSQRLVTQLNAARIARSERSYDYHALSHGYHQVVHYSESRRRAKHTVARASTHHHLVMLRYIWSYYVNNLALYRRRRFTERRQSSRYSPTHSLTHLLTHSPTHLLTHSVSHSLTHSLTHSGLILSLIHI